MKTILFVLPHLAGGGAERALLTLTAGLDRDRFRPLLVVLKPEGELLEQAMAQLPVGIGLSGLWRFSARADLVIGALELTATYAAVLLALWRRRPVWGWVHTQLALYPPARRWSHLLCLRLFYPRLDRILAVSASAAAACRARVPDRADVVRVMPNPLDLGRVERLSCEALTLPTTLPLLLCIGKLDPNKRFELAIRVLAELARDKLMVHLVILGTGPQRQTRFHAGKHCWLGRNIAHRARNIHPIDIS